MTKAELLQKVDEFASWARFKVIGTSDPAKLSGFADKVNDARVFLEASYLDPNETILHALQIECAERGLNETPTQLAELQIQKATVMKMVRAKLDGLEDRMKNAVKYSADDGHAEAVFDYGMSLAGVELQKLGIDSSQYTG